MAGRFITEQDIVRDQFDWGEIGWVSRPPLTGSQALCVMDVTLQPGQGHNFHKHPDQEEIIWVREGGVTQYLEQESQDLAAGEAVHIEPDIVHASFNDGDVPAKLTVMLSPAVGDGGYELVDMFEEEPWASLR